MNRGIMVRIFLDKESRLTYAFVLRSASRINVNKYAFMIMILLTPVFSLKRKKKEMKCAFSMKDTKSTFTQRV